jgi:hypothetical protein
MSLTSAMTSHKSPYIEAPGEIAIDNQIALTTKVDLWGALFGIQYFYRSRVGSFPGMHQAGVCTDD